MIYLGYGSSGKEYQGKKGYNLVEFLNKVCYCLHSNIFQKAQHTLSSNVLFSLALK